MPSLLMHTFKKRRYAFLALAFVWMLAYLHAYGYRLWGERLTVVMMIPGAMIFGWVTMPPNLFRVITGVEPSQSLTLSLNIAYWLVMIPLQIAYIWSKRSLILIVILAVLLVSTHGCYQWVNYDHYE